MDDKDEYDREEAKKRFEAALRGARMAGHKPKDSVTPKTKTTKRQQRPEKKSKASA
jgi:hypothetical protein